MKQKSFWIKERHNPQICVYYVAEGQLSKTAARKMENSIYGFNVMHEYETEEAYKAELQKLRDEGKLN
jgi:hypothetical protein